MISHKRKFIFVHIPKCGGTSVVVSLLKANFSLEGKDLKKKVDHAKKFKIGRAEQIKNDYPNVEFSRYFKFCFCRNPFDRAVSSWKFLEKRVGFNEFCRNGLNSTQPHWAWHTYPQLHHIFDRNGNKLVDFIGKLENFQADFNTICDKIGIPRQELPHRNGTKHKHYTEYYDDETREIVAEKYAKDIEYFGYEFK